MAETAEEKIDEIFTMLNKQVIEPLQVTSDGSISYTLFNKHHSKRKGIYHQMLIQTKTAFAELGIANNNLLIYKHLGVAEVISELDCQFRYFDGWQHIHITDSNDLQAQQKISKAVENVLHQLLKFDPQPEKTAQKIRELEQQAQEQSEKAPELNEKVDESVKDQSLRKIWQILKH